MRTFRDGAVNAAAHDTFSGRMARIPRRHRSRGDDMKRIIAFAVLMTAAAFAQAGTPRVDARQGRQADRIEHGVASGRLTHREAARLNAEQRRIHRQERRAKADGVVTARERAALKRSQNRANRHIRRQKHDGQHHR
jgi:hypothetical protein